MAPEDRDLPISLRGIENILRVLHTTLKEPSSIRQISVETDLSVRVTKNILLQLEKLKQVEQIVEKGQVNSKWVLTALGKENAKAIYPTQQIANISLFDRLLENIIIPKKIEEMNEQIGILQNVNVEMIRQNQIDLSKIMGLLLTGEHHEHGDQLGWLTQKLKSCRQEIERFRGNPLAFYALKKQGKTQLSNKFKRNVLSEILLANHILNNHLKIIGENIANINRSVEKGMKVGLSTNHRHQKRFHQLSDHIRILDYIIKKRKQLDQNQEILQEDLVKMLQKNRISSEILDHFLPPRVSEEEKDSLLEDLLIQFITTQLKKDLESHKCIPLITFYGMFIETMNYSGISIMDVEKSLEKLAQQGLIVGIREIKNGGLESYKIIQITAEDIMEEELRVLRFAIEHKSFSRVEIATALAWDEARLNRILEVLTANGLLRYTKSYLHGEQWFLVL